MQTGNDAMAPVPLTLGAWWGDKFTRLFENNIATPNLQQVDVSSVVNGEARTLRIYADDIHGIRMCDPDPALKALVPADARAC